jgi:hypothetical protein
MARERVDDMTLRSAAVGSVQRALTALVLGMVVATLTIAHCATQNEHEAASPSSAGHEHHGGHGARLGSSSESSLPPPAGEQASHHRSLACSASVGCAGTTSGAPLGPPSGTSGRVLRVAAHGFAARDADGPEPPVPRSVLDS